MIRDMLRDVQQVPERLATSRREARKWVMSRLHTARTQSETGLFNLQLHAFEGAGSLLDHAANVPVIGKVAPTAKDLLGQLENTTTAPPIPDYDELNVRKVMTALRDLDHVGLLRVSRHERATKDRKTVLDAVDRELDRRARLAAA